MGRAATRRCFDQYIYKARGVGDPVQLPVNGTTSPPGGSVRVVLPGATLADASVAIITTTIVSVYDVGATQVGDYVYPDGDSGRPLRVDNVNVALKQLTVFASNGGGYSLTCGARFVLRDRPATTYKYSAGLDALSQPVLPDDEGRVLAFVRELRFDVVVDIVGSASRAFVDCAGSWVMRVH